MFQTYGWRKVTASIKKPSNYLAWLKNHIVVDSHCFLAISLLHWRWCECNYFSWQLFRPHNFWRRKIEATKAVLTFFLTPIVNNTHQPAEMSTIDSIKVGYKVSLIEKLLSIFDIKGVYLKAYAKRKKKKRCKGIDFGDNPHLLDAMRIMKPIWEEYEGKDFRVDSKTSFWWKDNILPVSRECHINNYVGRSSAPIITKTLNEDDCYNICNLLENIPVKSKESGVNFYQETHGLKVSPVSDGYFMKA